MTDVRGAGRNNGAQDEQARPPRDTQVRQTNKGEQMSIRDIRTEALECRDNRDCWERERKHDARRPMWGTYRWDLCVRCGSWRCRIEASDGSISPGTTTYERTAAYEAALQFTREDARKELNRRANVAKRETVVVRGGRGRANLRAVAS